MSACKGSSNPKATADSKVATASMAQSSVDFERSLNEKFISYFSIESGKYKLDLSLEEAIKMGIDSVHYIPVKATVDTFNLWIEKYQITPELMKGGEVKVLSDKGESLTISLIGMKDIEEMKEK